ncbi:MAG: DedA family protein [Rickettsiales bacterium]
MQEWLIAVVESLGYAGVFFATLIESTFMPVPAEITVIPAGMLAAKGSLNYWGALACASSGVIAGSMVNYWVGLRFGRALLLKYGRYIFLKPAFLIKTERFFARYGVIAAFMGRLLPGVKHYIAFVAGIARMKFLPFVAASSLGGLIWMWLLLQVGFMAERSAQNSEEGLGSLENILIAVTLISVVVWIVKEKLMKH